MADIFTVTAPLRVRLPSGDSKVVAELCKHPRGLVMFDLYWLDNPQHAIHLLEGEIKGEGPWKIADHIFYVLGCHGTDAGLATDYSHWQHWLREHQQDYPNPQQIQQLAQSAGDERLLTRQLGWL